ncbi:MAG: protein-L-isoaspartate(D-aspartate) O-methyltransferase [Candidatus Eremiobacteraeota bacterium]|nr:protein-L-isoaspartate(D-aspartate) O-methyltransferase [Candidatus Eremiobacteraeota bacterium]
MFILFFAGCERKHPSYGDEEDKHSIKENQKKQFKTLRELMVKKQIKGRGVKDEAVLSAMRKVPRHLFVPEKVRNYAYEDHPVPIGKGQTISQPYIVALMTDLLDLDKNDKVLEVGTGSGYQAAVLAEIAEEVYTIEIVEELHKKSNETLKQLGYKNIKTKHGDGYKGWKENAPYDAIIVTAAPEKIPEALIEQLKVGGRLIIPVGPLRRPQKLMLVTKKDKGKVQKKFITDVIFVPLVKD